MTNMCFDITVIYNLRSIKIFFITAWVIGMLFLAPLAIGQQAYVMVC